MEIADFNGDAQNEIAVVYQNSAGAFRTTFISYTAPDQTSVQQSTTAAFAVGKDVPVSTIYGVAAGDFAGIGKAQLAVSYTESNLVWVWVEIKAFTADFTVASSVTQSGNNNSNAFDISLETGCATTVAGQWCSVTHRLEPALFTEGSDPSDPSSMDRRQLVFSYAVMTVDDIYNGWRIVPYSCYTAYGIDPTSAVDQTLKSSNLGYACLEYAKETFPYQTASKLDFVKKYPHPHRPPLQLAPGGYAGRDAASNDALLWGVATVRGATGNVAMLSWDPAAKAVRVFDTSVKLDPAKSATLTAYDQDNTSLRLGAPLVIEVPSTGSPVMIAAAPPVHMDWLYDETTGESGLDEYTWSSKTFLALETENSKASTTSVTVDRSTSTGVAGTASVKGAWEAGLPFVGATKLSAELKGGLSRRTETVNDDGSSTSDTISRQTSSETINDDLLVTKSTSMTVFRYPIIGEGQVSAATGDQNCGGTCNAFFDVTVPSSTIDVQADVAGKSLDWYQPTWLNGNLLSYPQTVTEFGDYEVIPKDSTVPVSKGGQIDNQLFTPGQLKASKTITVSSKTGTDTTVSSDVTTKQSEEAKISAEATANIGVKVTTKVKVGQSWDAEQRLGLTVLGTTEATSNQSMMIQVDGTTARDYTFNAYYYYDKAGVQRLTNSVNIIPGQNTFLTDNYGQIADPALNLPYTIDVDVVEGSISQVPRMTTRFSRQQIRGFEVLQASATGPQTAVAYASAPVAGDQVTFAVPVHNFSLVPAENTTVSFFAVPVNERTGLPLSAPVKIGGDKTIADLDARGMQTVYSDPWTAVGSSGATDHTTWNMFVQLNRDGDPDAEVHPLQANASGASTTCPKVVGNTSFMAGGGPAVDSEGYLIDPFTGKRQATACGSNNQGFQTVTVMNSADSTLAASTTPADPTLARSVASTTTPATDANVHLAGGGFTTDVPEHATLTETSPIPELQVGVPLDAYVTADADAASPSHQTVLIYDGPPEEGGAVIASTTLRGIGADREGQARFSWTPTSLGRHQLYQKLVGESGAGDSDAQIITVDVVPRETVLIPTPGPTGEPSATPSASPSSSASPSASPSATAAPAPGDRPEAGRPGGLADTGTPAVTGLLVGALGLLLLGATMIVLRRRARLREATHGTTVEEHSRE
ncbi:hypothetical protein [Rathayibacter sp. VKM Ac-2630]|uniref:hypothetical protein n=1 Tax=Rathayibacter sp. VKM Ac-2630 TaxID=1938617 RepID=UPI00098243B6|nr:hypothetical protein [Rathayibacter sp. VKM Ac-2630]OOB92095.1 hypothetical protein B0T42_02480 [Rathayibacter sp. VKM Ac-2630]